VRQYLLSIYQPDGPPPEPEVLADVMRDLDALNQDMRDYGVWVFGAALHPPGTATVVHHRDGADLTTDGPYTEGKEHIGGFTVIEVVDLDTALAWGRRLSQATTLPVEVRPMHN
jgi:hypothetical protein